MKEAGVEWVEWLACSDDDVCPHCLEMSGKIMRIEDVEFCQHPHCTNQIAGCRCMVIAIGGPDENGRWPKSSYLEQAYDERKQS